MITRPSARQAPDVLKVEEWTESFALPESARHMVRSARSNRNKKLNHNFPPSQSEAESLDRAGSSKRRPEDQNSNAKYKARKNRVLSITSLTCKVPTVGDFKLLDATFYLCDALELAPRLLGKFLRREDVILQITEVEAYRQNDTACHARFGMTARTAPLFGPGGHAYVYLCYGMHMMLNVVADHAGVGAAVLIRACAPIAGISTIQVRRGQASEKPLLLTGPGKVGQALGLTTEWSSHPLFVPGGLEILDGPAPETILAGPRVGIDYAASSDVSALWRFAIAGTPWVSPPRNTLAPM